MYTSRDVPLPVSDDDFAAWARIAVKYADPARSMPLLRLDRHGLTVAVRDDAELPSIGLPRRALIVGDSVPLCELRLVARAATRAEGHAITVTLQPSRADDHALLWQALCAYRINGGAAPSGERSASVKAGADQPDRARARQDDASARSKARSSTAASRRETVSMAASADDLRYRVACDTIFTVANHEDACFFSHWLDYHFAEVRARARMSCVAADLREMLTRVIDHEVEVRFVFHAADDVVRACTEAACRWIAAEATRQLGMTAEHWLANASIAGGLPTCWPQRAVMTSRAGSYSFSSSSALALRSKPA
ncbi:hypothetical protein [Trinickia acidisoli]|uniref:hypothetical protein n=1 Tax=Trinickia acidisoli TaxID=2767482 RepID=UPI001A9071A3|nr:hypothetical protein [Trinickia acidisoli]